MTIVIIIASRTACTFVYALEVVSPYAESERLYGTDTVQTNVHTKFITIFLSAAH